MSIKQEDKCRRCGMCCLSVPKWKDLTNEQRAMMRLFDKKAESVLSKVEDGCPNLIFKDGKATCLIYSERCEFCKALKPNGDECKFARGVKCH